MTMVVLVLIGCKAIEAGSQKRSEASLRRIKAIQVILLNKRYEECLRKIFRVFIRQLEFESQIFVNRLPICSNDCVEPGAPQLMTITVCGNDGGVTGVREAIIGTPDVCVLVHVQQGLTPS